jgi:chaperone BCS1
LSVRSDKVDIFANDGFVQLFWYDGPFVDFAFARYGINWNHIASRAKRPFSSIVLDDGIKELILEDARDFLKSKQWYADRGTTFVLPSGSMPHHLTHLSGIPFRRGYLLYGAPGSGKTSIIHSLAGELGLDIYIISLSKVGLDDGALATLISTLPEQCIAIMEDIDAAFTHGLTRDATGTELEDSRRRDSLRRDRDDLEGDDADDDEGQGRGRNLGGSSSGTSSRITLSGLLNALDGISAQEGRLLFATTNRYHKLDPALTRPGRMDLHVEFRLASQYQARELYKRFYLPDAPDNVMEDGDQDDGASDDSGYVTPPKGGCNSTPSSPESVGIGPAKPPPKYNGTAHSARAPKLSRKNVERLAEQFSAQIPDRKLSMASLQGYLMSYKTRPLQAVDDVERWIKETEEGQDRRAEAKVAAAWGSS